MRESQQGQCDFADPAADRWKHFSHRDAVFFGGFMGSPAAAAVRDSLGFFCRAGREKCGILMGVTGGLDSDAFFEMER